MHKHFLFFFVTKKNELFLNLNKYFKKKTNMKKFTFVSHADYSIKTLNTDYEHIGLSLLPNRERQQKAMAAQTKFKKNTQDETKGERQVYTKLQEFKIEFLKANPHLTNISIRDVQTNPRLKEQFKENNKQINNYLSLEHEYIYKTMKEITSKKSVQSRQSRSRSKTHEYVPYQQMSRSRTQEYSPPRSQTEEYHPKSKTPERKTRSKTKDFSPPRSRSRTQEYHPKSKTPERKTRSKTQEYSPPRSPSIIRNKPRSRTEEYHPKSKSSERKTRSPSSKQNKSKSADQKSRTPSSERKTRSPSTQKSKAYKTKTKSQKKANQVLFSNQIFASSAVQSGTVWGPYPH